jgi:hypothetical protein
MPRGEDGECGVCELLHSGHQPPPHTEDGDDLDDSKVVQVQMQAQAPTSLRRVY